MIKWLSHQRMVLVLVSSMIVLAGCGSERCTVEGTVTYPDGSPVPAGTVIGEATVNGKVVAVQGNIEPDGRFTLGGEAPGDGALPGMYKIAVVPVSLGDSELAAGKVPDVDGKFGKLESSGITFEVKQGKNELKIPVTKPKGKGGG